MAELLLVTTRWPLSGLTEFLDREILHLANSFETVRVAPMRPTGGLTAQLPANVEVDTSLAHALSPDLPVLGPKSRHAVGLRNLAFANSTGVSQSRPRRTDVVDAGWVRQALLSRADSYGVYRWARTTSRPDVGYTFWMSPVLVGLRRAWPSVPLITRAHGGDVYAYQHGWETIPQQGQQIDAADRVACVSADARDYLSKRFPQKRSAFEIRHLGVTDIGGLSTPSSGETIRILSVSSLDANKRVDLIARSLVYLANQGQRIQWLHLGDGPERSKVEKIANESHGLLEAGFPGQVDLSEVHNRMLTGGYNVFINLSKSEGVPVSIMEAQCVGLPVVATNVGGTSEVALASINELLSPDPTCEEVGGAIVRVSRDDPVIAEARRAVWRREFNADTNYAAFARELANMA